MSVLSRAEAYWRAIDYSGTGQLLDGSGNGHTAQLGSGAGADTNDPLWLNHRTLGLQYVYFPGSADNELSIAGLSNTTIYDYTVTYFDGSTDTGTETTDGAGNLVLGNTQVEFAGLKVKGIVVVPDGGGATQASADLTNTTDVAEPFATFTGGEGLTWTINRSALGYRTTIVDRDMFLLGTDDYFEVADAAGLDFDFSTEQMTIVAAFRDYGTQPGAQYSRGVAKRDGGTADTSGYEYSYSQTTRALTANVDDDNDGVGSTVTTVAGVLSNYAVTVDQTSITSYLNGVANAPQSSASIDDTANALSLLIGAGRWNTTIGTFASMEFMGAAIFREALSAAEIALAGEELLGAKSSPLLLIQRAHDYHRSVA